MHKVNSNAALTDFQGVLKTVINKYPTAFSKSNSLKPKLNLMKIIYGISF